MAPKMSKKRSFDEIHENTRQRMKLRSPSLIKAPEGYSPEPVAKKGKAANPKSTTGVRPPTLPPSPPEATQLEAILPPEARPTERMKAVLKGMKESRMKKPSPKKPQPPKSTPKKNIPKPMHVRKSPRRLGQLSLPATTTVVPQLPPIIESPSVEPADPRRPALSSLSNIPSELIPSISSSLSPTQITGSQSIPATPLANPECAPAAILEEPQQQTPNSDESAPADPLEPQEFDQAAPTPQVVYEFPEGDIPIPENPRSIRCKAKANTGDQPVRKTRGVVNGQKVANYVRTLGSKIKVEHGPEHNGPKNRKLRSMLTHEIGSCVRDKVPMIAASYHELEPEHWAIVFDHLTPNFELQFDDTWIWKFITEKAIERFRDWKSDCKNHYEKYGAELPLEFIDRKEQWRWLVGHFREPRTQARSQIMKTVRNAPGRTNHHSGKVAFSFRTEDHALKNDKAPYIAAYGEVYGGDAIGAQIAEKMRQRVHELMTPEESEDPISIEEPLPVTTQIEIITQLVGQQKRGTRVSGIGKSLALPPLPRGGARNVSETIRLTEELRKTQSEMAKQFEDRMESQSQMFMDQIRVLEELIKGGGTGAGASNASDGATSHLPVGRHDG